MLNLCNLASPDTTHIGAERKSSESWHVVIFKTGYGLSRDFKFNNLLYIWYWKEFLTVTKSEMFLVKKLCSLVIYGKGHSLRTQSPVMS